MTVTDDQVDQKVRDLFEHIKRLHPFNIFDPGECGMLKEYVTQIMTLTIMWERQANEDLVIETLMEYENGDDNVHLLGASAIRTVAKRQQLRRAGINYKEL
jgi:hypothetical protein